MALIMEKVTIRKATIDDLGVIQQLASELFEYEHQRWDDTIDPNWPFSEEATASYKKAINEKVTLVAERDGSPAGYLIGKIFPADPKAARQASAAYLENIYISSDYRGSGMGEQLIKEFSDRCKDEGAEKIDVMVNAKNANAIKFYEKMGYATSRLLMSKELK